ncbi:unnamed protein product [Protopolystoma xenopodis]|uniref:Uncharacterized protein n=1 Tax=Protopolystoma xenopodis TaxID=117903 RepID=A0A3S5A8L6_9PLAT|nr:unnamed protein product [Protopolystoma xenopodis]
MAAKRMLFLKVTLFSVPVQGGKVRNGRIRHRLGFGGSAALSVAEQRTKKAQIDKWPEDARRRGPFEITGRMD